GHGLPPLYFTESTGLLALISLGHWLEARARASAGSAIHELMNFAPATAWKLPISDFQLPNNESHPIGNRQSALGNPIEVPVAELEINDIVLVRPGDRMPIDGVV